MTAGKHDDFNDALSLMIECEDQKEVDKYWNAILQNGGKEVSDAMMTMVKIDVAALKAAAGL